MTPLTILHLAANRWWTGSADPVIQLVSGLRARGHRVLLGVIPGDRFEVKAKQAGLELVEGLRMDARRGPRALASDVLKVRALIRDESVDIVHTHHSHDHWLAVLTRPKRAQGGRPPVVRTFHNLRSVRRDRLGATLYRRTAAVFAVSRMIESRCREVGIPPEKISWIPGSVDLTRFTANADGAPIRDEFKLGDAPVVASVSRLATNRGHELLLSGFRLLIDRMPRARLLLVGKGETRARLEQMVAELGLGGHVIFTGYRDADLPSVLAASDCFALMAAGSDESCRAALEAMAAARPVIARRVGALPETVVHDETGLLIDDDIPESVARALETILGEPARGRAMGNAGRASAEERFSAERSVETVERVYQSIW